VTWRGTRQGRGHHSGWPSLTIPFLVALSTLAGCGYGTPGVDNPLPLSAYRDRPCSLLSQPQLESFGVRDSSPNVSPGECDQYDQQGRQDIKISVSRTDNPLSPEPIKEMYKDQNRMPELHQYFNPVNVQDYPGVFASDVDQRNEGQCELTVGASDDDAFRVSFSALHAADQKFTGDPCGQARSIADTVITNLKQAPH
jgi:hypothetical protein